MPYEMSYEQQLRTTSRPQLVIADDEAFMRSMLIVQLQAEFDCVGSAADATEAIALVAQHRPDVVILDANMPGGGAMRATQETRAVSPETAIVILSGDESRDDVINLLSVGAITYLRKGIEPTDLVHQLLASITAHRGVAQRQAKPAAVTRDAIVGPLDSAADVVDDIPSRQHIEHVAKHFAAVVRSFDDAIIGQDLEGFVTSWNRGAERLYGYTEAEIHGKSVAVLMPPGQEADLAQVLRRLGAGEQIESHETVRVRKDGTRVDVSLTVSALAHVDGSIIGASTIARDITNRLHYQEQLRYLSEHDELTGTRNRRRFDLDLTEQIERARRYGEPSALLMIDINGFKQINDLHGHSTGDQVLKAVADALTTRLRATDVVARFAGDEFMILLPYAGASQADATSEALRQVISETSVALDTGTKLSLSASIGISLIDANTLGHEAVLGEADRAMYHDKARQAQPTKPVIA
jgi:diguanylate cyclase (GGDEF)-like protein/PAS domain S-box-containing protein